MPRFRHSWSYLGATLFLCFLLADCVKGECQPPPSKTGLELTEEEAALDTFDEGSSVTFKCGTGYTKVSGDGTILCRNGIWTVETLQCQKKSCGSPGYLINGRFSTPEGTDYGATAYASCNRGYEVQGTAYRQCFDFGWSNRVPLCEIKKCADPPTIVNGRISSRPDTEFPVFRDIVQYKCDKNYNLVGDSQLVCNELGSYNGTVPQCKELNCPDPSIKNAQRVDGGPPPYKLKYFVTYRCNEGYVMEGQSRLVCEATGWSSDFPTCNKVRKCADPPTIVNGRISSSPDKEFPEFGDIVQYTCDKNYNLVGDSQLVCNEFGSYNGMVPQCKGQCQPPPSKTGLELTEESAALDTFDEGSSVTFKCGAGYTKVSGDGTILCRNGSWTVVTLQCQKKSCGSPGDLINGRFSTPNGTDYGATAFASCNRGYEMQGTAYRQCYDFGWNNRVPRCEIKKCADPPTIVNGRISSSPDKEFPEFRDIVQYTCDKNYNLVGDSQLVCNEFGSYNGTVPQCKELNCPTPSIKNAQRVDGGPPPYKLKYFVTYRCDEGYVMEGQSKLVCEATGWSSDFPTCNKVLPPPVPTKTPEETTTRTLPKPGPTPDPDHMRKVLIAVFATLGALAVVGIIAAFLFKSYKKKRSRGYRGKATKVAPGEGGQK
ncbi:complement decay-accelerating factor transmembrane isoform-like isoform X2 [Anguilla anguilla]|uniref:complement decay-accelerating factor transmembrane isoform-like isoform X2 n=1 Tax=Anguilla anguilla TaxID=7936 RepID=UPI0015B1A343|nr:complement decay-accelerating factor transmembrane isoform-like isoform X2 [Anguilla anguilla]